jgi:hypothetical protein
MAEEIQRRLDLVGVGLDLQQLVDRLELLVDSARRLGDALADSSDHGLSPRPGDARGDAGAADSARAPVAEVVLPRVEVELGLPQDAARLEAVVVRLLDRPEGGDSGQADGRGLDARDDDEGPGAEDNGAAPVARVDGHPERLVRFVVAEHEIRPERPRDDAPIGATLDEILREFAEALEVDRGPRGA